MSVQSAFLIFVPVIAHGEHWHSLEPRAIDGCMKPPHIIPIHAFMRFSNYTLFLLRWIHFFCALATLYRSLLSWVSATSIQLVAAL